MAFESFLLVLLLTAICGAIGQAVTGFGERGMIITMAVGFTGALFGFVLSVTLRLWEFFPLSIGGYRFPVIWSIAGSVVVSFLFNLMVARFSSVK